ncbi:hypothetical protein BDZ97DRAFT_1812845 [Flammula alnicola]|nr:hypothetical protein BDZ97DRAFT_1812845 [Flammula alnicola]
MSNVHPPIQLTSSSREPHATPSLPSLWGIPLKYLSLVTLAVQNSALTIIMHYSRVSTPPSRAYSAATAVLMNEILKGTISLIIAFSRIDSQPTAYELAQAPYTPQRPYTQRFVGRLRRLWREVFSPDCWKLSIPAILYVIQKICKAATFQVTYQMKILTTAAFSPMALPPLPRRWCWNRPDSGWWGYTQLHSSLRVCRSTRYETFEGLLGCCVYFEMVLKNSQADLWVRNVQLSLFSLLPAIAPIAFAQQAHGSQPGQSVLSTMFNNFGAWAWVTVWVQVLVV